MVRSRSCISCAKGKARCDNKQPECSRCTARAIECRYPTDTPKGTVSAILPIDRVSTSWHDTVPLPTLDFSASNSYQEVSDDTGMILDGGFTMPTDLEVANLLPESLDWNSLDVDLGGFVDTQTDEGAVVSSMPEPSLSTFRSFASTDHAPEAQVAKSFPIMSIPKPLPLTVRSFVQRPRLETGTQRIANLVLHTLKSYPLMILRQNTLPPFIHPLLMSPKAEAKYGESLDNCISLIHMLKGGLRGSRKLFWKNVRLECERMLEEVC